MLVAGNRKGRVKSTFVVLKMLFLAYVDGCSVSTNLLIKQVDFFD